MTGMTTLERFSAILARSGTSQPLEHSQCASKNVKTSPLASAAPLSRARMRPSLFESLIILTTFKSAT